MFKKDLLLPALLGLGIFAGNNEISLTNNTTMLLLLYVILQDHQEINELQYKTNRLARYESRNNYNCGCCNSFW